jgi:hypothetical protein
MRDDILDHGLPVSGFCLGRCPDVPVGSRSLPIVEPCSGRVSLEGRDRAHLWCATCSKPVHDLSAMRTREVRALLVRNAGRSICVQYRMRCDGTIAIRPDPSPGWFAAATVALAGCASQLHAEIPEVDGLSKSPEMLDPAFFRSASESARGDSERSGDTVESGSPTLLEARREPSQDETPAVAADPSSTIESGSAMHVQVNFAIDPQNEFRGRVHVREQVSWYLPNGRLRFIPTREIISELRERWRERSRRR